MDNLKLKIYIDGLYRKYILYKNNLWIPKDNISKDLIHFFEDNIYNLKMVITNPKYGLDEYYSRYIHFEKNNEIIMKILLFGFSLNDIHITIDDKYQNLYSKRLEDILEKYIDGYKEDSLYYDNHIFDDLDPIHLLKLSFTILYCIKKFYGIDSQDQSTYIKYFENEYI